MQCPLAVLPVGLPDFLFPFSPTYLDKGIKEDADYSAFTRFLNREAVSGALQKRLRRGPPSPQAAVELQLQLGVCGTSLGETRRQPRELLVWVCSFIGLFGFVFLQQYCEGTGVNLML